MSEMVKIHLVVRRPPSEGDKSVRVEVPALPRVGDHVSHDKAGISGYVKDVMFWWDEKGKLRDIEVSLK